MVDTIKKWLGIDGLEREKILLAKAIKALRERVIQLELATTKPVLELQKNLTTEPAKPKLVEKPQRVNWKQFRSAAEKASDPKQEE